MMTPSDIEILIHCHVSYAPHPRADAQAVAESISSFLKRGAIVPRERKQGDPVAVYQTTALGRAWITALCNVPKPRTVYVGADGEEIKEERPRKVKVVGRLSNPPKFGVREFGEEEDDEETA